MPNKQAENARALCKGAWALGSACGCCQRCIESAPEAAEIIRRLIARLNSETPWRNEWQVLWKFHRECEKEAAGKQEYENALIHQKRAEAIERLPSTGDINAS